jgi:hypothetical protein
MNGGKFRATEVTSAARWVEYAAGALPVSFTSGQRPKAIFINAAATVTLVGEDDNSVVFTPAPGIPIQLRPKTISATNGTSVIVLFD